MDMMKKFRPESHEAQQSRRHKLRHHHHMEDYDSGNDNLEHLASNVGGNTSDFMQIRGCRYGNISYDPSLCAPIVLEPNPESSAVGSCKSTPQGHHESVANLPNNWERIESPPVCDWNIADYASESSGIRRNTEQLMVEGELRSGRKVITNESMPRVDLKPAGYFCEDVNCSSPSLYQNTLQDVVTSATRGSKDSKRVCSARQSVKETRWSDGRDELVPPRTGCTGSSQWMGRSNNQKDGMIAGGEVLRAVPCSSQALSLSLSVPPSMNRVDHQIIGDFFDNVPSSASPKDAKRFGSNSNQLLLPNCSQDMVDSSTFNHRRVGPLGPFTGYASILTCSKFLRPAEQLLEDLCNGACPEATRPCQISGKFSFNDDVSIEPVGRGSGGDSAGSSSTSFGSNTKKEKLLYMQYEVSRRYKQFHQQMQLVVSSFESVAGLRSAAPYFLLALDKITKHFKALKNSISDQIRNLRKSGGEDSSSPASMSKLNFVDPAMPKQVVSGGSVQMLESQSQVWRPQRCLPERAVAVLRAWLFDHFLHPYPTDTDKHMLANQTGLTKNQVSNWFINARVRIWKPMIEEIHMLEGQGLAKSSETDADKTDNAAHSADDANGEQDMNNQVDCPGVTTCTSAGTSLNDDFSNLGKRPRSDYQTRATPMDGSLIGFSPYQRTGIGMEGLGGVTLTLGLRQSAEIAQQQELQQFGGQMIHDFVG